MNPGTSPWCYFRHRTERQLIVSPAYKFRKILQSFHLVLCQMNYLSFTVVFCDCDANGSASEPNWLIWWCSTGWATWPEVARIPPSWAPCPCRTNGFEGLFSTMLPVTLPPGVLAGIEKIMIGNEISIHAWDVIAVVFRLRNAFISSEYGHHCSSTKGNKLFLFFVMFQEVFFG